MNPPAPARMEAWAALAHLRLDAWAALVHSLPTATWLVDGASLRVVAANAAAHALLGRTPGTLLGERADQLVATPEDLAFWDEAASGVAGSLESEATLATADGRTLHVTRSVRPVGGSGADGITFYAVSLIDRTEARQAEDRREQALAELRATLESTADGILVTDLGGRIRVFNRRFAEIWGVPEDLLNSREDEAVHDWLRRSVLDTEAYQRRLRAVLDAALMSTTDRLELHSGRVVERVTRPLQFRGRPLGRVFSFRDLSERVAADQRLEAMAQTDQLTGLPNRGRLAARIAMAAEQARQEGTGFALLFIDLDRFCTINDTFGAATADRVLCDVGLRIRDCMRQGDVLARIGGDQFAMLVHRADTTAAEITARRVLDAVSAPRSIDGAQLTLTCTVGIALGPLHGSEADELLRNAEAAMRVAKDAGRGSFRFHTVRREHDQLAHLKMDHAMRQALAQQRFRLHYQPQIDIASGRIVGAEALLRWRDPEMGDVSPGQFVPVAEESGFIVALGDWVMAQAIRQAALWRQRGFDVPVAVNVSALQFSQPDFVDRVGNVLAASGLEPRALELELTESLLVHDAEDTMQRLTALARLGVRLSIDDFGTGYSSLAYLKRFPIGKLKIDRSFVKGLPDDESDSGIVRAILQMARALDMTVVAEGVETEAQRRFLQECGCHEFQGFLYSPALDAARFEERLTPAAAATVGSTDREKPRVRLVHG